MRAKTGNKEVESCTCAFSAFPKQGWNITEMNKKWLTVAKENRDKGRGIKLR